MAKNQGIPDKTSEDTPNPVAGMHPAELKKAIEDAKTTRQLQELDYNCAREARDPNGVTRARIRDRIAELGGK